MVPLLLFLIAMVLLFGAGAVKGWLKGIALYALGGMLLLCLLVTLGLWLGYIGALSLLLALTIILAIVKAVWLDEASPAAKEAARAKRQQATDEAWARWLEENKKPEPEPVQLSAYRLSKSEKKRKKDLYLKR